MWRGTAVCGMWRGRAYVQRMRSVEDLITSLPVSPCALFPFYGSSMLSIDRQLRMGNVLNTLLLNGKRAFTCPYTHAHARPRTRVISPAHTHVRASTQAKTLSARPSSTSTFRLAVSRASRPSDAATAAHTPSATTRCPS